MTYLFDETWIQIDVPETKQQKMELRDFGSSRAKKFCVQKSTGNVLALVFWDYQGIIIIYFLVKGQKTIANLRSKSLTTLREKNMERKYFILAGRCPCIKI